MKMSKIGAAAMLIMAWGLAAAQQPAAEEPVAPPADAEKLLADALAMADKEGKSVFLTTHASW